MRNVLRAVLFIVLVIAGVVVLGATSSWAQTETIIHTFTGGSDGEYPDGGVIFDGQGNLYGVANGGSTSTCTGCGMVFEFVPSSNGTWTKNILYNFGSLPNFADGVNPNGRLSFDGNGNLYGTTNGGGSSFGGSVFQLVPGTSGNWTEKVLYNFTNSNDGAFPYNGVVIDNVGNLYGVAQGGIYGFGLVFELVGGTNGTWTFKVLYSFRGNSDGAFPSGQLLLDPAGKIYGVAEEGGAHDGGLVFELAPGSKASWTERVIYAFPGGSNGSSPAQGLIRDGAGDLFGTASFTAYELSPNANGTWTEKTLHRFVGGADGAAASSGLAADTQGNLYGTTFSGGLHRGTVYELSPLSHGAWSEKILHKFSGFGTDGVFPSSAALAIDSKGDVFGITQRGGSSKLGILYEVVP